MASFGRRKILIDADYVDESNLLEVLGKALAVHSQNARDIHHLYDVYRGKQDVLRRTKDVRPEINNKLLINHANEIVSFKVSYLLSDPIAYVSRSANDVTDKVNQLNEMMFLNNKAARDKEIADDFTVCGTAYRMALPNDRVGDDEPPFVLYTLNPFRTFVAYSSGLGEKQLFSVHYVRKANKNEIGRKTDAVYSIYTDTMFYEVRDWEIVKAVPHYLGMNPIIEYVNNNARIGAFEVVETLLDAMNVLASNRVDATEQAVQALTIFKNCDINSEDFDRLKQKGALKIKSSDGIQSDVYMLTSDLNQTDQQVLMDALYDEVLRVTGMPSQSTGNTSDSSNNGAVIVRNGWYNAEARAKDTELLWRESEGHFLKLVLKICRDMGGLDLKLSDVTLKFTRRNYEDLLVRSQVLTTMLANPMIDPKLAFNHCGMFVDSEEAYRSSMNWYEQNKAETEKKAAEMNSVNGSGKSNSSDKQDQSEE